MFIYYVVDFVYFKVIMVGDAAVGKTSLAFRFSEKPLTEVVPTVCE